MTETAVRIFDIGFSVDVDGPGQRMVVYLKGCNLYCPWCASPESIAAMPQVLFYPERVEDSAAVCQVCPYEAVRREQEQIVRDLTVCAACTTFACAHSGQRAFELVGYTQSVEEIVAQAIRYRAFLGTHGGVTIGGGEPTCQFSAVDALLGALQDAGLHTAMETNGTHRDLPALFGKLDLLLIDIKHPEELPSAGITRERVNRILENMRRRHASGGAMQVRIPLVPGYNADAVTLHRFGEVLAAIGVPSVELIPFHRRGEVKWQALGRPMPATGACEPSDMLLHQAAVILLEHGVTVKETHAS